MGYWRIFILVFVYLLKNKINIIGDDKIIYKFGFINFLGKGIYFMKNFIEDGK